MKSDSRAGKLLQSGIIFTVINFMTGLGNLAFQVVIGHHLKDQGQFGNTNTVLNGFMPLLSLPPQVATMAVTHYIAHYNSIGDTSRLQGLLASCKKFLVHLTLFGCLLILVAIKPLSDFFHYSSSLMLITGACTVLGLWSSYAIALCQGLAWFKRLAFIGFLAVLLRLGFGWFATLKWPYPEIAVLSSAVAMLAYLVLLFWRKELSSPEQPVAKSLWTREFILYLVVSTAYVVGNFCFQLGDLLVIQRHFQGADKDAYAAAERLAVSLPITVAPMLTVLFTNRSAEHTAGALRQQLKLLGLYSLGLLSGAVCLIFLRHLCLKVLGKDSPEAAEIIQYLAVSMIFVGLLQAVGTWALASKWSRISLLYGSLGIIYWVFILFVGKTPGALIKIMPVITCVAFVILFAFWLTAMRRHKPLAEDSTRI